MAEKMISLGKASDLHTKRQVYAYITKEDVAKKLFDEISPKYADRNGGYTRIIKIGIIGKWSISILDISIIGSTGDGTGSYSLLKLFL